MIVIIVLLGVVVDAGIVYLYKTHLDEVAAIAACDIAENPGNAAAIFNSSLSDNVLITVTGTYNIASGSVWVNLNGDVPAYFLQIIGINSFPISGRARCLLPEAAFKPIAVRMSAVQYSLDGNMPEDYEILGSSPKWDLADVENGKNFVGSVFLHMRCKDPNNEGITNCPQVDVWQPLESEPPSPQSVKDLAGDCFSGIQCNIRHPVGSHLPIVSGVSNKFIVNSFCDAGCWIGQKVVVLIFDGEVYDPDPTYGNWENVRIIGFAVYEVTEIDTNTIKAKLFSGPFDNWNDIDVVVDPREIQWDFGG